MRGTLCALSPTITKSNKVMKKLIGILIAFIFSFTLITGQSSKQIPKVSERDTLTINVISENPKVKIANDNLNSQLARSVENQYIVNSELATSIRQISELYGSYLKSTIASNSSPPIPKEVEFLQTFGYDKDKVKNTMRKQWVIHTIIGIPVFLFLLYLFYSPNMEYARVFWKYIARIIIMSILMYTILLYTLTLFFNPAYMDIIKLSKLMI